jgi:Ca2+-transporting ATPase
MLEPRRDSTAGRGDERQPAKAYGLRPDLLAITQVWPFETGGQHLVAAKGAPEAIATLCRMNPSEREAVMALVEGMAAEGLRVIAIARADWPDKPLPETVREFAFTFVGLAGLADPLRASVPEAVRECRSAGIRVIMITGDYPATALAIARKAGLDASHAVTGDEIDAMSDRDLARCATSATVFARIMPAQKLRIMTALKADGETVAMTGDGVNDAPSLKAAHIRIAMGGRGTDVAREASSIVLLDDDFGSIVRAVRLGRRIHDNLRKSMGFVLAVHVPIAGLALMPLLFGLPIMLGPVHIALIEMVIDPVCSLVFEAEAEEDDIMERPPRPSSEPMLSIQHIGWSVFQGAVVLALVATIFAIGFNAKMAENELRTLGTSEQPRDHGTLEPLIRWGARWTS